METQEEKLKEQENLEKSVGIWIAFVLSVPVLMSLWLLAYAIMQRFQS